MPESQQKNRKPLRDKFSSFLLSNQKEIVKRGMTCTEQKLKGTHFKVQSIAIANPIYFDTSDGTPHNICVAACLVENGMRTVHWNVTKHTICTSA